MIRKYLLAVLLIFAIGIALPSHNSYAYAREFSKSGAIYQAVKDGVVTVFSATGHGSGFLVDADGLVITNSHVVNDKSGHLRVKFGQNQVVEALLVENDRDNDIAILAVNLKNIATKCPLPLFLPSDEPEALPGEKVLAIGTPADRYRADQTLSEGVVGKLKDNMIFHDASITNGSSGGPLLNFDGKVIGINSINWNGLIGAISIVRAKPLIGLAQQKLKTISEVSPLLLPG